MTTNRRITDVVAWLLEFAPLDLAEPWDNVGLLWGDPQAPASRVMTCLTVTPESAEEALREQASLIVSHHPVLFRPTQRIRADLPETRDLWRLARAGTAIYSPHTAFDNARGGINDLLCRLLDLRDVVPLRPAAPVPALQGPAAPRAYKVVVFAPESDREPVMAAAFQAGAGQVGAYRECSFAVAGHGTFFGTETTDPTIGERGRRETVAELRLEFVCPAERLGPALSAVRTAHSYEEPAIDVYPMIEAPAGAEGPTAGLGAGRIGRCDPPRRLGEFAAFVGRVLGRPHVPTTGALDRTVDRVAVACGAGGEFLADAARAGADVFLTGEARFHGALEADALGVALITAGHYATERPGIEDLASRIAAAFPGLSVWPSRDERSPFQSVPAEAAGSLKVARP